VGTSKDRASQLWDLAQECRAIAAILTDPASKADYLKLAESYLELAAKEETLAKQAK
jgi:hypothetical protein